jgi:isopentenyldiphosphate isomerase
MKDDNELLDIVDENDLVVGKTTRSKIYKQGLQNHRVINAFLQNSKGQIWVNRRSKNVSMFPGGLDLSVGGHVKSGESYEQALKREVKEELNIDLNEVRYCLLDYLSPYRDGVSAFTKLYMIESDQNPKINRHEFADGYWITPEILFEQIKAGMPAKSDLPKLLEIYCSHQNWK